MFESGIFDGFFFMGPTPNDIFKQYTTLTGSTPLPPVNKKQNMAKILISFFVFYSFGLLLIINVDGITMTKTMSEGKLFSFFAKMRNKKRNTLV